MEVNAIQVNFADYNFNVHAPHDPVVYQYYIEGSTNGKDWTRLVDEEKNLQDAPHKLHTLNVPAKVQYLKICNTKDMEGSFLCSICASLVKVVVRCLPKLQDSRLHVIIMINVSTVLHGIRRKM